MGVATNVILPVALAFIMFSLGLGLTLSDFFRVFKQPGDFLLGFVCQVFLLPLVALALVIAWGLPPELGIGVMIIAAAPGGVTSNLLTSYARGDVALSISLTAVVSVVGVITVPAVVLLSYPVIMGDAAGFPISVSNLAFKVFLIVTVPVLAGLGVRHFFSSLAIRFGQTAKRISTVLFVLVLVGAIAKERDNIVEYFAQAGLITLVLNIAMMALAYFVARFLASGVQQRIAISIECGLQNGTLAIAVAVAVFGGGLAVIPAATYSLIMFATSLLFILFLRKSLGEEVG